MKNFKINYGLEIEIACWTLLFLQLSSTLNLIFLLMELKTNIDWPQVFPFVALAINLWSLDRITMYMHFDIGMCELCSTSFGGTNKSNLEFNPPCVAMPSRK